MAIHSNLRPCSGRQSSLAAAIFAAAIAFGSLAHAQAQTLPVQAAVSLCFVPSAESCTDDMQQSEKENATPSIDLYMRCTRPDSDCPIGGLRHRAEAGDAKAQSLMGTLYFIGKGVPRDIVEAANWYRRSSEQGDVHAQVSLAEMLRDDAEAVKWYRQAAAQGDPEGQRMLGHAYADGRGLTRDDAEAVTWFQLSAAQGNVGSQYSLGVMYREGRGVHQDYAQALKWFRLSAAQRLSSSSAKYALGLMYANGEGVAKNAVLACMWITLGTGFSSDCREVIPEITPRQITEAEKLAADCRSTEESKNCQ
jgi:TPR repeat protein